MSTPDQPLAKAPDAALHPVTGPTTPDRGGSADPPGPLAAPISAAAPDPLPEREIAMPKAKEKPKRKSLKPGKGHATSDAILGATKDKLVDLGVRVPKSVRKRLKAEAKERGVSPDAIVSAILDAALDDRR